MREVQLTYKQGEVAPATTSDLVVMKHGKTLKEELSTNSLDRFSREVTVTSSMEKIVDGACNGAYESLVFKGRSLVNLLTSFRSDTSSAWVKNGSSFTLNSRGVSFLNHTALLKPSTTYTVIGELDFDVDGIVLGFREGNKSWEVNRSVSSRGRFTVLISTSANSTSNSLTIHRSTTSNSDRIVVSDLMVLEGDWTNIELPPYFEGLESVKMPVLRNVGKNLFDINGKITPYVTNSYIVSNGVLRVKGEWYVKQILPLKTNTKYTVKMDVKKIAGTVATWSIYYNGTSKWLTGGGSGAITITTPEHFNDISILFYSGAGEAGEAEFFNIQVEESPIQTSYQPYKSNTLTTPEEIILRSLPNGTQDTYNPLTGEYAKRVGEIVLDGSEAWIANTGGDKRFEDVWVFHNQDSLCDGDIRLCNKLQARESGNENAEFVRGGGTYVFIYISKNKVQNHNALDFKAWLSQNPLTIQYELETPIIKKVESKGHPFAYENGHVILESSYQGQSLLPELVYSIPASKSGVLSTASKMILIHEQRLHKLEDLLLREGVLMDYRFTLSLLDEM